jgi:hypothetical protein
VSVLRITAVVAVFALLTACAPEPTASELAATGITKLKSARTVHLDGTGAIGLKAQGGGLSFSFEFKLAGDAELPDKARLSVQTALLGMSFNVETITLEGKEYTKDAVTGVWSEGSGRSPVSSVMDPLGSIDASVIRDVVEVDRPEIDGRKTRHLRYQADTAKMLDAMRDSSGASTATITNPQGTGELWIRIDNSQVVRQLVKVSADVDGLAGFEIPGATPDLGKTSLEMSLDMRFSRHGEAVPQITAPPVGR